MLDFIYKKVFLSVLNWFCTLSAGGFDQVIEWIKEAETAFQDGTTRAAWVKEQIKKELLITSPFVLNLLTEVALAFAKKKGWIEGK